MKHYTPNGFPWLNPGDKLPGTICKKGPIPVVYSPCITEIAKRFNSDPLLIKTDEGFRIIARLIGKFNKPLFNLLKTAHILENNSLHKLMLKELTDYAKLGTFTGIGMWDTSYVHTGTLAKYIGEISTHDDLLRNVIPRAQSNMIDIRPVNPTQLLIDILKRPDGLRVMLTALIIIFGDPEETIQVTKLG